MLICSLHNKALKCIPLSLVCTFKKVIISLQIAFSLLQQLDFARAVFMTFCECKGMKIGSNSEKSSFPDFFVTLSPHLIFCIINRHFTAERIKDKIKSCTIRD